MENCIFCKIVHGQIPATKIFENQNFLAFLDINPLSPGHCLIIPNGFGTSRRSANISRWHARSPLPNDKHSHNRQYIPKSSAKTFHTLIYGFILTRKTHQETKKTLLGMLQKYPNISSYYYPRATIPGKVPKARKSHIAPPPVEMNENRGPLISLIAAKVSPPPTIVCAPSFVA